MRYRENSLYASSCYEITGAGYLYGGNYFNRTSSEGEMNLAIFPLAYGDETDVSAVSSLEVGRKRNLLGESLWPEARFYHQFYFSHMESGGCVSSSANVVSRCSPSGTSQQRRHATYSGERIIITSLFSLHSPLCRALGPTSSYWRLLTADAC